MSGTNLILLLLMPLNLAISRGGKLLRVKGKLQALVHWSQGRRVISMGISTGYFPLLRPKFIQCQWKSRTMLLCHADKQTLASALKTSSTHSHSKKWFDEYQSAEFANCLDR